MELMYRIWSALRSRAGILVLKARGVRFLGRARLLGVEVPHDPQAIVLGDGVALDRGVTLIIAGGAAPGPKIEIGRSCYVNRFTLIDASERIRIGDHVLIGPHVYITDHDHGPDGSLPSAAVSIGDRVWIGAHVSILKGVTLGTGAVVGAGAVVTKDVAPGQVVAGNPQRILRDA